MINRPKLSNQMLLVYQAQLFRKEALYIRAARRAEDHGVKVASTRIMHFAVGQAVDCLFT